MKKKNKKNMNKLTKPKALTTIFELCTRMIHLKQKFQKYQNTIINRRNKSEIMNTQ